MDKIQNMNYKEFISYLKKTNKELKGSKKASEIRVAGLCKKLLRDIMQ